MRCPECRSTLLKVHVSFSGDVACQFSGARGFRILEKVALNSEFDKDAACCCLACGWNGQVAETRTASTPRQLTRASARAGSHTPLSPELLERIKKEIESFEKRPKQISQRLVKEIQRLASLLDTVTRFSGRTGGDSDDTWIG